MFAWSKQSCLLHRCPVERTARLAMPDVCVEQAARLTMPASPWSTQSCVPHRQSCRWSAFEVLPSPPRRTLLLWDRHPMWGRFSSLRPAFQPAWVPFTHRPMLNPMPSRVGADQRVRPFSSDLGALPYSRKGAVPRGASRQACHADPQWSKPPGLPCRMFAWSKPPGLPCRPLRGARSLACHTGSHAGGRLLRFFPPRRGERCSCGTGVRCGAGFLACGRLSSRPGHPLPTALCSTQCRAV